MAFACAGMKASCFYYHAITLTKQPIERGVTVIKTSINIVYKESR
jgi:hypothetical protein